MSEVTRQDITDLKSDIKDLYDKNNETNKAISGMAVNVAEIATTIKTRPIPSNRVLFTISLEKSLTNTKRLTRPISRIGKVHLLELLLTLSSWPLLPLLVLSLE